MILIDINMPRLNGIQATKQIVQANPEARVIVLTMYRQDHYVFEAIKAGARGYLLKTADAQDVLEGIRRVHQGKALIDSYIATMVIDEFRRISQSAGDSGEGELSAGEMDVLRLVGKARTTRASLRSLTCLNKPLRIDCASSTRSCRSTTAPRLRSMPYGVVGWILIRKIEFRDHKESR